MKQVTRIVTYAAMIAIGILVIMTILARMNRKSNLQNALNEAVKSAVEEVDSGNYHPDTVADMKSDFVGRLCSNLNIAYDTDDAGDTTKIHDGNMALQIDFTDSSVTEGVLGVKVQEKITYPSGKDTVLTASAIVLLEDEGDKKECTITYLLTPNSQAMLKVPSPLKVYTKVKDEGGNISFLPYPDVPEIKRWHPTQDYPEYGLKVSDILTKEDIEKIPVEGDITLIDDDKPGTDPSGSDPVPDKPSPSGANPPHSGVTPPDEPELDPSGNVLPAPYEIIHLKEVIKAPDPKDIIEYKANDRDFIKELGKGKYIKKDGKIYEVVVIESGNGTPNDIITSKPKNYKGYKTPDPKSMKLVSEEEPAVNVLFVEYDRLSYILTIHKDDNIINSSITLDNTTEQGLSNNDTVIGKVYYGTPLSLDINTKDGYTYTITGDTEKEDFTMPERDAEVWVTSKESTYTVELVSNGGTFNYGQDNKMISTSESTKSPTELSYVHYYTDDWTLPWVDSDNKTKSNGNNGIKNQSTSLMYRDGYIFEGWTDVAPSKDVYNNYDTMPLEAFKEYVTSKGGHFYNDVAEVSTKDYSEDNVSTKGIKNKGEIRLYAKWRLQYFVVRYHSDAYEDTPIESDMNVPKGKTAIDTNNGKFYEMAKDGTYPSVWLADNTLGEGRIRTALGFDENSNADFSSWTVGGDGNPDKDNFSIGVTVADGEKKEEDLYTELDGSDRKHLKAMEGSNNVPNGTVTVPSGLAGYISHSSDAKAEWVDGKYVMVIDLYPTYTYAIKVNLHGNAEEHGVTYESSFYAHYAVTSAYSVPDMKSYNNSAATFKGVWDIARLGSDNDFDGSLNPYLLKLGISEKRRCKYYPKENETPYSYSDFYWSANGGNTLDLYAQWNIANKNTDPSKLPYTVVFTDPDGSKAANYSQQMWPDISTALTGNRFSVPGYAFAGWVKTDGDDWTFNGGDNYTSTQTFTVPKDGWYFIEAYGAKGGGGWNDVNANAVGGYTYIRVYLTKGQTVSMNVGHSGGGWGSAEDAKKHTNGWPDGSPSVFSEGIWKGENGEAAWRPVGGGSTSVSVDGTKIAQAGGGGATSSGVPSYVAGHPGNDTDNSPNANWNHSYGNGTRNDAEHVYWRYPNNHYYMSYYGGGGGGGYVNGYGGYVQPYWTVADYTNKYSNSAYGVNVSLTFGCDNYQPDGVNKSYNSNGGQLLSAAHGGTGYVLGGTTVGSDLTSSFNDHVTSGRIVTGSPTVYKEENGKVRIRYIYADKQEVTNLAPEGGTVKLKAIWSTSPLTSFNFKTSNIRTDIMELKAYSYLQTYSNGISEVPYSSKAYTLPDLGKENGFMGWYCESGDVAGTNVGRTYTLPQGSTGTWRFSALWADHYAVSVWGINHDDGLNSGGIVFGSAMNTTNNDYDTSYIGNSPLRHVHDGECIHNDYVQGGWARVIYYCQIDPERYRKCMEYGCTVPVYFYGSNGDFQYGKSIYTALTKLGGDTGIGDGATQIDYSVYQSNGTDDIDHNNGGWRNALGGKNKVYTAYDNSDMPDRMSELYSALCNSDLKTYMSDSTVRFATQSKSYVKGLWDSFAAGGQMEVVAPVTINSDGTTTKGTETIGANFIHDLRNGVDSSYKDVEVYNYATISGQKFFLPSAHEIFGSKTDYNWCRMFQQGYAYDDSSYVLNYLDGDQYEKFKSYSFNGNLFIAANASYNGIKKDNLRLNTQNSYGTRSVVLRTPGSSLTRARVTYLYSYGGLNTAGFTTQDYAVTPCFRIKK